MKLFLASANNTLPLLAERLPQRGENTRVLFIANASDRYAGDKWWVAKDKGAFDRMKACVTELDLRDVDKVGLKKFLDDTDIVHFTGGSALYLMSLLKSKDFGDILSSTVRDSKIIYSGTSAGSMITAKNLQMSAYDDEEILYAKDVHDFGALGLVDFLIIPHANSPDFIQNNKTMLEHLIENPIPLIFLHDDQAIWVENDSFQILNTLN